MATATKRCFRSSWLSHCAECVYVYWNGYGDARFISIFCCNSKTKWNIRQGEKRDLIIMTSKARGKRVKLPISFHFIQYSKVCVHFLICRTMKLQQQQPQINRLSSWPAAALRLIERIDKSQMCLRRVLDNWISLSRNRRFVKETNLRKNHVGSSSAPITTTNTFAFMAASR